MKKAIILASTPISHIIPLEPLSLFLNSNEFEIHCFSCKENEQRIVDLKMIFHEYPKGVFREIGQKKDLSYLNEVNDLWKSKKVLKGYKLFIEMDTRQMYNINKGLIEDMRKIIESINPAVIFRDSADKIGYYLSKELTVPVIGYITNNLYSDLFFNQNPEYLYSLLLNVDRVNNESMNNKELNQYFKNYRENLININKDISKSLSLQPLNVMHQFDPMNYLTLIFSIDDLQPNVSLYKNRKYDIVYPTISRFNIENIIDEDLKNILNTKDPIIYIATGSIFSNLFEYYVNYINVFSKCKCRVIISCKDYCKELNMYIKEMGIKNIFIRETLPQKYVLSKANLFITSGGQNSILEAIFFEVPMLLDPISSEQRMNGLMIESIGVGLTSNKGNKHSQNLNIMVKYLLTSSDVKQQLHKYSKMIKTHDNDFEELKNFLRDNFLL